VFLIYGKTDIGKKRLINQDAFAFGKEKDKLWVVVCDGLGGENAGEVASKTAVAYASDFIKESIALTLDDNAVKQVVIESIKRANDAVLAKANEDSKFSGMSTTIVSMVLFNGILQAANVGDSRIYLISGGTAKQLTKDHSVVQVLLDSGQISPKEASKHPNKNCLVKVLGLKPKVIPSYACCEITADDKILICSDGLYSCVTKKEMIAVIEKCEIQKAVDELVNLALVRGGNDNITVVLAKE
jgi:protein phosphatase